ncbi:histidine phosphatase family protein [Paracoccus sp. (in: a-proteobacteria)]|uniref:histidine phosphatase family protein n=1 Tax=Paracoccus sp. TaxID=267 RepID=UPI003A86BAFB
MFQRLAMVAAALGLVAQVNPIEAATFYFIRHAESTANTGQASTPAEVVDPPLTALGQQQAVDLAVALQGIDLTTVYVSKYQRTQLTIAPAAADHGLTPVLDPNIHEWSFGTTMPVIDEFRALFGEWGAGNYDARLASSPDSESLNELNARVLPAYRSIIDAHKDEDGGVAIVGHGGSIGWTMPFFANNVTPDFALANSLHNTAIVKVRLDANGDPMVTDWDGIRFDAKGPAPVPLPSSALMLLAAAGGLGAWRRARRAA